MMAPHVNPSATEYGIILGGLGSIQVVFPNGTTAMNADVSEGDVFWIPRYFPFCQLASRGGPLQFFGFTTSSRRNRPQFLAGRKSVLRMMRGPALAAAFNVSEKKMDAMLRAQREEVILPMAAEEGKDKRRVEDLVEEEEVVMMKRRFMFGQRF